MKKGFTLVEIIISISIILIIGVSITFFVLNKKNEDINVVNKQILEAANTYIKVEKDINGKVYANEIIKGAQGVQIPLSNLVNSGYIDETLANKVYAQNPTLDNEKDYYVLFVQEIGGSNESYCNENEITSYVSWMPKGENIYLCNSYSNKGSGTINNNFFEELTKNYDEIPQKNEISYEDYSVIVKGGHALSFVKKRGLFKRCNSNYLIYYYRGNVDNNNVKFNGKDFKIISFTEPNLDNVGTLTLIADETIKPTDKDKWFNEFNDSYKNIISNSHVHYFLREGVSRINITTGDTYNDNLKYSLCTYHNNKEQLDEEYNDFIKYQIFDETVSELTNIEAIYSGVIPSEFINYDGREEGINLSTVNLFTVFSDSFLGSTDQIESQEINKSTIIKDLDGSEYLKETYNYNSKFYDYKYNPNNEKLLNLKYVHPSDTAKSFYPIYFIASFDTTYDGYSSISTESSNLLRPVITINYADIRYDDIKEQFYIEDKIKFTGSGAESNPYIIEPIN